ncbi:MAG: hypothetical protein WCB11_19580 [Terriglobales bacterium]
MKYAKPEAILLESAIQTVQSSNSNKNIPKFPDSATTAGSTSAYEADE